MKQSKATVERGAGALIRGEKEAGVAELPCCLSPSEAAEILGCFGSHGGRRAPASPGTLQGFGLDTGKFRITLEQLEMLYLLIIHLPAGGHIIPHMPHRLHKLGEN